MVAFQIFWFSVYWYGIFYFISFLIWYFFLSFLGKKEYFKKYPMLQQTLTTHLDCLMIFLLLWVLIGGRLGHFLIYDFHDFHLQSFFMVWNGWMSFIGGIIGVVFAVILFKVFFRLSWKEWLFLFDCILVVVPLGIFFWRLGNFLNQELYGIVFQNPGFSEWVVSFLKGIGFLHVYPQVDNILRINTNLLSMLFEWILLLVLNVCIFFKMIKRNLFSVGLVSSIFVVGYGLFRFFLEYLRNDSQSEFVGIFTKSQRFFVFFLLFGCFLFFFVKRQNKKLL